MSRTLRPVVLTLLVSWTAVQFLPGVAGDLARWRSGPDVHAITGGPEVLAYAGLDPATSVAELFHALPAVQTGLRVAAAALPRRVP